MKLLNWFLNLVRNSKKIAQDAIDIVNLLKSIVESEVVRDADKEITGNTELVDNAGKWLTGALNTLGVVKDLTVKGAIINAVNKIIAVPKPDRGPTYTKIAGKMHSLKTGTDLEVSKTIVEQVYQEGK